MRRRAVFAFLLALCACTQFPELDATQTPGVAQAPYPRLLPLDGLLVGPVATATPAVVAGIEGRVAALRARADRLRGPVVPARIKARMRRGVTGPL
ncbi:MAG: hypothetical protein QNJ09_03065 [Paracoccaceae bacterium]|nr:hypothetical protein [Paracoccaceae bacterium]